MKINISENELKKITSEMIEKVLLEVIKEGKTKKFNKDGYLKASRSGSRDAEKEIKGDGFKSNNKVHKSPKDYNRKGKNQNSWKTEIDESVEPIGTPYRVSKTLWGLDVQGPNGTSTIYARKIKDFGVFLNSQLNSQENDLRENEENEVTYKTAVNARDKAVVSAFDDLRINGSNENEPYHRKIRQIGKFSEYPNDIMQKLVGTKVEVVLTSDEYSNDATFNLGVIKSINQVKPHIYVISTMLANKYGTENESKPVNITVDLTTSTYKDNESTLEGITDDGRHADIKMSNKKARLFIASLLNKKGNDEFMKTFR